MCIITTSAPTFVFQLCPYIEKSSKEFKKLSADYFGCDTLYGFKLVFALHPVVVAHLYELLLVSLPSWMNPEKLDLLWALQRLTLVCDVDGVPVRGPMEETEEIKAHVKAILETLAGELHDKVMNTMGRRLTQVLAESWGSLMEDVSDQSLNWKLRIIATIRTIERSCEIPPPPKLGAADFLKEGAKLGCTSKSAFKKNFVHPEVCALVWNMMEKVSFKAKPRHLLLTLLFLKASDNATLAFAYNPKIEANWMQRILIPLSALFDSVVVSIELVISV